VFEHYCHSLEAGISEKLEVILPWIPRHGSGEILDVGCGTGMLASHLSSAYPEVKVIAIDRNIEMVRAARRRFASLDAKLVFRPGSALSVSARDAKAVVFSSVLHEVYSDHGYTTCAVLRALESAKSSLGPDGRLIIRDFVSPSDSSTPVWLKHLVSDIVPGHSFCAFMQRKVENEVRTRHFFAYQTSLGRGLEYALRKDFHSLWGSELRECYGFWDLRTARSLLAKAGFKVIYCRLLKSRWLRKHSLSDKIVIADAEGRPMRFPADKVLIVAEPSSASFTDCLSSSDSNPTLHL